MIDTQAIVSLGSLATAVVAVYVAMRSREIPRHAVETPRPKIAKDGLDWVYVVNWST